MKQIYLATLAFLTIQFYNCSSSVAEDRVNQVQEVQRPKTPEELRQELKELEQSNPQDYLQAKATMSPNRVMTRSAGLFHDAEYETQGYDIKGRIKNLASVARFKDVVITVSFISKTETVIEQSDFTFYEFYEPNSSKNFSVRVYPPEATETFSVAIKKATAVN